MKQMRYLKFLKDGSTSCLTSAELEGIGKIGEVIALNKVNYQDVLDIRKQNVVGGNCRCKIVRHMTI